MTHSRLKTRLLRQAVEDNVATINGALPKPLRRRRRIFARWGPRVATVLCVVALTGALRLRSGVIAAVSSETHSGSRRDAGSPASLMSSPSRQRLTVSALSLGINRIVIDAGHGGGSQGTTSRSGLREKDITLDIAARLRARLLREGIDALMTRDVDATLSLQERSTRANAGHGDLFVSIHLNALAPRDRGVETYYVGASATQSADAIASDENRDSGYSMADMRTLIDEIYLDARRDESKHLAESVQRSLMRGLGRVNPSLTDRGVKTAPFLVLVGARMPAILAEVSCLSNSEEAELLTRVDYRQSIADSLFDGIHDYLRAHTTEAPREFANGN
jgi:N-acetylmuramoyl-L-alanine amidase